MLQIGITGGIGSGKTTVCKIVESLGFPVYYADDRGRYITDHDPMVLRGIRDQFGPGVFDGLLLNRKKLGEIVFKDEQKLFQLNRLVHPAVRQDYADWLLKHKDAKLVFSEIAILFEIGRFRDFDKTILVTCPDETRIKRVMERSNLSREDVKNRMTNQWPDEKKAELAHFVIDNDGIKQLNPQVEAIIQQLKALV